jgi:hypothetical protein
MLGRDEIVVNHQIGRSIAFEDNFGARVLEVANNVVRSGDLSSLQHRGIGAQQPEGVANRSDLGLFLQRATNKGDSRRLIRLAFLWIGLIAQAVHCICTDQDDASVVGRLHIIDFGLYGNVILNHAVVRVAAELQLRVAPQVRHIFDFITLLREKVVEHPKFGLVEMIFDQYSNLSL